MVNKIILLGSFLLLAVGGYHYSNQPKTPEGKLVKSAFNAIRDQDWKKFEKLFVNRFELLARKHSPNRIAASQSFSGGVMKPEEDQRIRVIFAALGKPSPKSLDFSSVKFEDIYLVEERLDQVLLDLDGLEVPTKLYGIKTVAGESTQNHLDPLFLVIQLPAGPKILDIISSSVDR